MARHVDVIETKNRTKEREVRQLRRPVGWAYVTERISNNVGVYKGQNTSFQAALCCRTGTERYQSLGFSTQDLNKGKRASRNGVRSLRRRKRTTKELKDTKRVPS